MSVVRDRRACVGAVVLLQVSGLGWSSIARATETEPEAPLALLDPRRLEVAPPVEPPPDEAPPDPDAPPPPPVDLLPPLALARAAGIDVPPRPRSEDPVERAEDRTDRDLRRELRRDSLRAGGVDGYFYELGRAMRSDLEVDPLELQADVFRGLSIPEAIVTELGRYGPRERPIEPRGTPLPDDRIPSGSTRLDPEAVALQEMLDQQSFLNGHVTWHRCEVRVLQNARGEIFDVQLLRSSGMPTVDHAALEAARHAVLEAPPPERIIEGRDTLQSDWAIEVGDVATDPTQVGCTDPADLLGGGCGALGRGVMRTRVELLDVVDAMHPPDPE
jgi:TonB family protein